MLGSVNSKPESDDEVQFVSEWRNAAPAQATTTAKTSDVQKLRSIRMREEVEKDPLAAETFQRVFAVGFKLENHDAIRRKRRVAKTRPSTYECDICSKKFKSRRSIVGHIRRVHNRKNLQCQYCTKAFGCASLLKAHSAGHVDTFLCVYCKKGFKQRSHMQRHVRNMHEGQACRCDVCAKAFSCGAYMRKHFRRMHK